MSAKQNHTRLTAASITVGLFLAAAIAAEPDKPFTVKPELLDVTSLPKAPGMEQFTIYQPVKEDGDNLFNNHPQLIEFKGHLYATWQGCAIHEDSSDSHVLYSRSPDGENWSKPAVIGPSVEGHLWRASSGWWTDGETLYCLMNRRDSDYPGKLKQDQYRSSTDGEIWSEITTFLPWGIGSENINALPDGRLIWVGHGRGTDDLNSKHVAIFCYSDNGINGPWKRAKTIEAGLWGDIARMIEPSWFRRADDALVMVYRDLGNSRKVWAALSTDRGETWGKPRATVIPDSNNMQCAGNLPNGSVYMVNTTDDGRQPLVLWLSRDGNHFDRAYILRGKENQHPRYAGRYKNPGFSYSGATVWNNHLYVATAAAKENIEIMRIPLAQLIQSN